MKESEDIIQESFLTSFQKISNLKDPNKYAHWLKRIVVNNSLKSYHKMEFDHPIDESISAHETNEDKWYQNISLDTINQEIQNLPNGCRSILTLYLMDGFKHKEIAELFGISISTSKSQYRYGLNLLQNKLKLLL